MMTGGMMTGGMMTGGMKAASLTQTGPHPHIRGMFRGMSGLRITRPAL